MGDKKTLGVKTFQSIDNIRKTVYRDNKTQSFSVILNAAGLVQDYEFRDIEISRERFVAKYNCSVYNIECNIVIQRHIGLISNRYCLKPEDRTEYYEVFIDISLNNIKKAGKIPSDICNLIGNFRNVKFNSLKINIVDSNLVIGGRTEIIDITNIPNDKDKFKYSVVSLLNLIRDCIYSMDATLLDSLGYFDSDETVKEVYYQSVARYDNLDGYKETYTKIFIPKKSILDYSFCIGDISTLILNSYSKADELFYINSNTIEILKITNRIFLKENISLVYFEEDNEENGVESGDVYLVISEQPRFVGVNGDYTRIPVDDYYIGKLNKDTNKVDLMFNVKDSIDKNDYTDILFIHITDEDYVYRSFIYTM